MTFQETFASIAKSGLPLQAKLDAFKSEFDTNLAPPAAVEALHRSVDELSKRPIEAAGLLFDGVPRRVRRRCSRAAVRQRG